MQHEVTIKEIIKRALCHDNSGEHEWNVLDPANIGDRRPFLMNRIHCLKCGTFLFRYHVALHIINNQTLIINDFPTWSGDHPAFDPMTRSLPYSEDEWENALEELEESKKQLNIKTAKLKRKNEEKDNS